ncbi:TPA: hypothetical protein DCZ32_00595 [Candidatus Uhrbacteria bacterium]|nr:hypothetical protein [Candidatus Uhrbacteria bacterium]
MTKQHPFSILASAKQPIIFFAVFGLLLALLFSFLRPLLYSSTVRLLVIQQLGTVDAYTAGRSAERIADDLATAVYTTDFYELVMASGLGIDKNYFGTDEIKKRKKWGEAVSTSVSRGSGFLTIKVFHEDVSQAEQIGRGVASVLTTEGWKYTGGGNITISLVDAPLNSRWPVKPNIPANAFSGLVLGLLAGSGYVLLREQTNDRRHQVMHG